LRNNAEGMRKKPRSVRGPLEFIRYVFSRSRQPLNTQFFPMLLGLPKIVLRLLI